MTAALAALFIAWSGGEMQCKVLRAVDGDTLEVACNAMPPEGLRVYGLDTPERGEPGYREAGARLAELIDGRVLSGSYLGRDKYGRMVVVISDGDTHPACTLIAEGLAIRFMDNQGLYAGCLHRTAPH